MPDTLRLFVALYPPTALAETMLARTSALNLPAHRATPAEQVHMTLQFIGDANRAAVGAAAESVERSAAGIGQFTLTPARLLALPQRGPARLIAAATDAPAPLRELQRRLAHRLARSARKNAGDRFLPHFTLLRFSGTGARHLEFDDRLEVAPFQIDRIFLMHSTLKPQGTQHREVASFAL